jgi:N-acetylmuramoyl-L-alanine amidase
VSMIFRQGDRGPAVAEIKARLARLGLVEGSAHVRSASMRALMYPTEVPMDTSEPAAWATTALVSADFDEDLEIAVRRFQQERGITVDGIVGPETFRRLEEARWQLGDRVLKFVPGSPFVGEDALQLQQQLNRMGFDCGKEDAHFGSATDRAVREFQRNTGLAVDGVVGALTLRALGRLHRTVGADSANIARESYTLSTVRTGIQAKIIIIDTSPSAEAEPEAALKRLAGMASAELTRRGALVSVPPTVDADREPLDERQRAARYNQTNADLVVSLHADPAETVAPRFAVYFYGSGPDHFSAAGRAAAEELQQEFELEGECLIEPRSWDILRATRMPAVRISFGGFLDQAVRSRLTNGAAGNDLAERICDGLTAFFKPSGAANAP